LIPSVFDALDDEDKALMIAFEDVASIIESYHVEQSTKKKGSKNPFEPMPGEYSSKEMALAARRERQQLR